MRRAEILSSAAKIVTGRDIQHGDVENSFPRIAQMWSAYKGVEFTPVDVTVMLILLKVARISTRLAAVNCRRMKIRSAEK